MGEGQAVSEMGHAPIGPVCPPDVPAPLPASRGVCLEGTVLSKWSSVYFILLCGITLPLSLSHVNRELHVLSWVCILQLCVVLSLQLVILQGPETSTCLDIQTGLQYYIQVRARPNGSVYAGYWSDWSPRLTVDTPSDIGTVKQSLIMFNFWRYPPSQTLLEFFNVTQQVPSSPASLSWWSLYQSSLSPCSPGTSGKMHF